MFGAADAVALALLGMIWGCSFLFINLVVAEVAPLWLVTGRVSIGAAVLLAVLRVRRRRLPRDLSSWWHLLVLAALSATLPWSLLAWAQQAIPSGLAAVLNAITPIATLAIAVAVRLEPLSRGRLAGLALAILGTLVVVGGEVGAPGRLLPVAAVVGMTVLYGAGAVYAKRTMAGREPAVVATGQMIASVALALPAALLIAPQPAWADLSAAAWGSWLGLGGLGTGVAFLLYYRLIDRVGATNATMVTYLVPPVGVLAGWLVLDERLGPHVILGAAIIVAGVYVAQRERRAPEVFGRDLEIPA